MARQTKLTPEVRKRICEAVRVGNTYEAAARLGGITEQSFYQWRRRGRREKDGEYAEFDEAIERADSECELEKVAHLHLAGTKHDETIVHEREKLEAKRDKDGKYVRDKDDNIVMEVVATEKYTVTKKGVFDWKADQYWLIARKKANWNPAIRQEVSGPDGEPLPVPVESPVLRVIINGPATLAETGNGVPDGGD